MVFQPLSFSNLKIVPRPIVIWSQLFASLVSIDIVETGSYDPFVCTKNLRIIRTITDKKIIISSDVFLAIDDYQVLGADRSYKPPSTITEIKDS
jgi:hypothetical protein